MRCATLKASDARTVPRLANSVSILAPDEINWSQLLSARHLTDAYLLALAVEHRGRLITLDQGVPIAAVKGAKERHLVVIE